MLAGVESVALPGGGYNAGQVYMACSSESNLSSIANDFLSLYESNGIVMRLKLCHLDRPVSVSSTRIEHHQRQVVLKLLSAPHCRVLSSRSRPFSRIREGSQEQA